MIHANHFGATSKANRRLTRSSAQFQLIFFVLNYDNHPQQDGTAGLDVTHKATKKKNVSRARPTDFFF